MRKYARGSFTVEAAFIFPIILFVIFSLICVTFYIHDKCRLQAVADRILHKASLTIKHEADIQSGKVSYEKINDRGVFYLPFGNAEKEEESIREFLQLEMGGGLLAAEVTDIKVIAGKWKIEVSLEGEYKIPIQGVLDYFQPDPILIKVCSPVHNPAETVRIGEIILDTGEKIKGLEELKNKIDQLCN